VGHPLLSTFRTFTLLFSTLAQASSLHIDVAAYYDTPVISLRDVLLPRILNDPTSNPTPGGVLGPEGKVGLEVKKWFRNVPEDEKIAGDAKVVDGVDLMHVSVRVQLSSPEASMGVAEYERDRGFHVDRSATTPIASWPSSSSTTFSSRSLRWKTTTSTWKRKRTNRLIQTSS
jgi:hypothetical protein